VLIFESILTSFKPSIIFGGSWGSTKNWLEPKTEPPPGNLACPKQGPKSVKRSVWSLSCKRKLELDSLLTRHLNLDD